MTPHPKRAAVLGRSTAYAPSDHYQAWQAAHLEATLTYLDWRDAAPEHKRDAYAVYRAAADREDAAAASWIQAVPE